MFARRGLAATMAEVAAAADVSQGLAYRYFAGKDELFRALVEEAVRSGAGPDLCVTGGTPGAKLRRLLASVLKTRREHPEFFRLIEHVMHDPDTPADLIELCRRRGMQFVDALRDLIVAGQPTGEVAEGDPETLALTVLACLEGLTTFAHRDPEIRAHFPDADVLMRILEARRPSC